MLFQNFKWSKSFCSFVNVSVTKEGSLVVILGLFLQLFGRMDDHLIDTQWIGDPAHKFACFWV